ncbi:sensor histidine kinase [Crateriforma spongiae]|uniref:sensor histidine kinase n=1 Tax=Crateriforma spongiae TaxID=2724528 RepID=UPI0014454F10|nr:hybrid sensor histidine kinase/response regulator [Crateriforma spongiae]
MEFTHRRIVVIDDDSLDREQIVRLLGSDFQILSADSARQGLDHCQKQNPDCVLLDYRLPDADGIATLQKITPSGIPVIMLTGEGDEEVAATAIKSGAFDYFAKKRLDKVRLHSAIQRAIEHADLRRRLSRTRQELEDLVGMATSELKTPLEDIERTLRTALVDMADDGSVRSRSLVSRSADTANDLRMMVHQLLHQTQVDEDQETLGWVDMNEAVAIATERLVDSIQDSGAKIRYGDLPTIWGDRSNLIQLIQNLLSNAIKFCEAETPLIDVRAESKSGQWLLTVSDNGIGIPIHESEDIFVPLKRLYSNDEYPGHGLGLAACRKITQQHGGRIWLQESDFSGSVFCIALPDRSVEMPING